MMKKQKRQVHSQKSPQEGAMCLIMKKLFMLFLQAQGALIPINNVLIYTSEIDNIRTNVLLFLLMNCKKHFSFFQMISLDLPSLIYPKPHESNSRESIKFLIS